MESTEGRMPVVQWPVNCSVDAWDTWASQFDREKYGGDAHRHRESIALELIEGVCRTHSLGRST